MVNQYFLPNYTKTHYMDSLFLFFYHAPVNKIKEHLCVLNPDKILTKTNSENVLILVSLFIYFFKIYLKQRCFECVFIKILSEFWVQSLFVHLNNNLIKFFS